MGAPSASGPPQIVVPGSGWVDVLSRAIVQVGFPVVVACALLWFVLVRFQGNMELLTTRWEASTRVAETLIATQKQEIEELEKQTVELQSQSLTLRAISDQLARGLGPGARGGPN
jgi:hypothetical protein